MILEKIKNIHLSIKVIFAISFLIFVILYVIDSGLSKQDKRFRPQALGIDVSHYQGNINWSKVALSDISFAYAKATGGETYTDPKFEYNWHHIRTTDIHRGAYHFFFAYDAPKKQAEHFIKTIGKLRKYDLPPMLDIEVSDHESYKVVGERALIWLQEVEKATKRIPIIYTNSSFGREVLTHPEFSRYPLWIADYEPEIKKIPSPWKHSGWTIWQHSSEGVINGIKGNVDLNLFHSDAGKLIRFIEESHTEQSFISL
jgi:lysozyme